MTCECHSPRERSARWIGLGYSVASAPAPPVHPLDQQPSFSCPAATHHPSATTIPAPHAQFAIGLVDPGFGVRDGSGHGWPVASSRQRHPGRSDSREADRKQSTARGSTLGGFEAILDLMSDSTGGATHEQASWAFASDRPISDASEVRLRNIQFGLDHR